MESKKIIFLVVIVVILFLFIFLINLSSANFSDLFRRFTGHATQQATNVSTTIVGTNKVTVQVFNQTLTNNNPTENSYTNLIFFVVLSDVDGVADINTSSVSASFSRGGESLRYNNSCAHIANINSTSANFSCTIQMWYFDGAGTWNITASGNDFGNTSYTYNNSTTFQYNQLQAIVISPTSLTWPTLSQGGVNQTSNNDPTLINNTGNYNIPNITVTGLNLHGLTNSSEYINVANFTVGNDTSLRECDISANRATILANGTDVQIKNTVLSKGNHSINDGSSGQEQLYYCIRTVPAVSSQIYSTTYLGGQWFIKIT